MSEAGTVWTLVLADPEPQVPEALRAPALAHLAAVLGQPLTAVQPRIQAGAALAKTEDAGEAQRWQAELSRAGWRAELRETAPPPRPAAPPAADWPAAMAAAPVAAAAPVPVPAPVAPAASVPAPAPTALPAHAIATPAAAAPGSLSCSACGAPNAPQANFCGRCGASLDHLPPLPGERNSGALLGSATSTMASIAGLRSAHRFSLSDLLSETFTRRTPQEIEAYMSVGTLATTPPLSQISPEWPRPWLFARLLLTALLVALMFYATVMVFRMPVGLPGMLVVSCFVVPFAVVLLFYELNVPRNVTLIYVLGLVIVGGVLSILVSVVLFTAFPEVSSLVGASSAGLIEELGKLLAVVYATRRLSVVRYRYILNGMLFGAAVGAGFAAFESAGYAMSVILQNGGISAALDLVVMRGWMAPMTHVLWTAITAGALWRVKGAHSYSGAMLADWRFVRVFLIAMMCHAIWNASIVPSGPFMLKYWLLGAVGWMVALSLVQEGLEQVRSEQRAVGIP